MASQPPAVNRRNVGTLQGETVMSNFTRSIGFTVAAALALTLGGACLAQAQDAETQTKIVSIADLDLHSAAGAALMHQRIRHAALSVCTEQGRSLPNYGGFAECVAAAQRDAQAQTAALAPLGATMRVAQADPTR
jgi:UrcA family protein